jgi:tetratricopeptide (TPR) repeat protein
MSKKTSADELFRTGLHLLGEANPLGALSFFERAYAEEKSPVIQSYLGYCIAAERGQITEALKLCRAAIEREPENPEHYLNIGRVYLKAKRKDEAIAELRKGLSFGDNEEIKKLLDILGLRKKPVFPFLPRHNFLNKYGGLILRRLRLR